MSFSESLFPNEGPLPKWLFLVSFISCLNSIQSYASLDYAKQLYAGSPQTNGISPVNNLSARTFGTWTFLSSVVRIYAAYNISSPIAYDLAIWTYGIALTHFVTEWLIYGSAQLRGRFVFPLIVALSTAAWMLVQRAEYVVL